MIGVMNTRTRVMPRSLTHPAGIVFLDPAHRVSREELDRRDARWRAMREKAYTRAWSDEATLVGSVRRYAAQSSVLREWEEQTVGRRAGGSGGAMARIGTANTVEEGSTVYSQRPPSSREGPNGAGAERSRHGHRLSHILPGARGVGRRPRKFKDAVRRWVNAVRV